MEDIKITFSDVAYVYFHDLPPEGIIEVNRTTQQFRQVKQNDFYVYFYTQLDPADEFRAFKKWIDVLSIQYSRFVFIGYQYGALFSLYFSSKIENSFSVSLDGTNLIETTQHIAYDVLELDKNKPIIYMQDKAVCDGHDLYKEWTGNHCVQIYRSIKKISNIEKKHDLIFYYVPFEEKSIQFVRRGENKYNLYYPQQYPHAQHMAKQSARIILKKINLLTK